MRNAHLELTLKLARAQTAISRILIVDPRPNSRALASPLLPVAAQSLNVTLALCSHLRLLPAAASSQPPCAEPTLGNFLRFSAELEPASALDLMHAECLRGLAEVWQSMQRPGLTPMQFTQALHLLNEHVAEALAGAQPPWQAAEVLTRLRAFGGEVPHFDVDVSDDLCLGSAISGMSGWMSGWF